MVEAPDLKKLDEKPPADVKVEEEESEAVEGVKFDILEEDDDFEEFKDDGMCATREILPSFISFVLFC